MVTKEEHMFREHSAAELVAWTRRLHHFRFMRAQGGHAQDGDFLIAELPLRSGFELSDALISLGWVLDASRSEEIKARTDGIWFRLNVTSAEPALFQAPAVRLESNKKALRIEIFGSDGDPYSVTEADVKLAEELEAFMNPLDLGFVEPLSIRCFSERTFPEYFRS